MTDHSGDQPVATRRWQPPEGLTTWPVEISTLHEDAEDAANAGVPLETALAAVRSGYSEAQAETSAPADHEWPEVWPATGIGTVAMEDLS